MSTVMVQPLERPNGRKKIAIASIDEDGSLASSKHRTKPCRYFLAGYCAQGNQCKFKHPANAHQDAEDVRDVDPILKPYPQDKKFRKYPSLPFIAAPLACIPSYIPPMISPTGETPGGALTSPQLPPAFYMQQSFYPLLSPVDTENHAFQMSPIHPHDQSSVFSPPHLQPESASSSSSAMTDDLATPLENVRLNEHYDHAVATMPSSAPEATYVQPGNPVLVNGPIILPPSYVACYRPPMQPPPNRERSQSQPPLSRKKSTYKTKPCKFFRAGSVCQMGDKCTYKHELDATSSPPLSQSKEEGKLTEVTDAAEDLPKAHLPPKPLSPVEESRKKGFYPISWRVIGGGVMMGGKRPPCPAFIEGKCEDGENCRFSHEINHELEKVEEATPAPRTEPAAMEESGPTDETIPRKVPHTKHKHHATKSLSIVHTPDPDAKDGLAESSEGIAPRPKSMCISSSEAMRLQLVNLFSNAESP